LAINENTVASRHLLALFAAKDLEALIETAIEVIRLAVPCDIASAFYRSTGDGLLKQRDSRGREYCLKYMRRYMELTPAIPIALANRGVKILRTGAILPRSGAQLKRTAFYREIMKPEGWRHGVALCFWGDPTAESPVFVTSVYRSEGQSDFSAEDIASLENVYPFIDCAVNAVHEREAATSVRDGMAIAVRDGTRGFAILDRNLLLVQANAAARRLCAAWVDDAAATTGDSTAWRLPTVVVEGCRELRYEWQSLVRSDPDATGLPRRRRLSHPRVPGLTASITMVCPNTSGLAEPTFVLELDRRVHGVALETADRAVPLLQKMTAAERAVAMILADGFSNQEIADRLGKTIYAVKFLLHRIYQRTGIPSRAALVAVLRSHPNRLRKHTRARQTKKHVRVRGVTE
jgi:DNA-binding CsgD family transcriptional regulator